MLRQSLFLSIIFLLIISSCKNKSVRVNNYSIKDSILKEYLSFSDSTEYFDTAEASYKLLKAYQSDDTGFLKKLDGEIKYQEEKKQEWRTTEYDSCIHQLNIASLKADEAYRFIYTAPFCPYKINVTVSKKEGDINLHFIIYRSAYDSTCLILNEYDKKLTEKNWDDIIHSLEGVDFWGLKRENRYNYYLDGDALTLIGYIKGDTTYERPTKINYVHRSGAISLRQPLDLVLELSGNKQGCYYVTTSDRK